MKPAAHVWAEPRVRYAAILLAAVVALAALGPEISPYGADGFPNNRAAANPTPNLPPCAAHWCGTDLLGRDVLTRTLHGTRVSLAVGLLGAAVSLAIGVSYGAVSGYVGGTLDAAMMRAVDVLFSIPRLVFVIVLVSLFDERATAFQRMLLLFTALGAVQWLTMARVVRGQALAIRERQYVTAAEALGQSHPLILARHVLPNLAGVVMVYLTLTIPVVILEESLLSFLGLGIQPPLASLGTLIADGTQAINPVRSQWWLLAPPCAAMAAALLALNFLGDGLRDALDPSAR